MEKKDLVIQLAQATLTAMVGLVVAIIAILLGGAGLGIGITALVRINNYINDTSIWIYELGADMPSTIPNDETLVTKGSKLVMNYVNETANETDAIGGYTLGYPSTGIAGAGMQFCQSDDTDIEIYLELFTHGFTKENMTCSGTSPGLVYLERLSEDPTAFLGINTIPQCNLDVVGSACLQNLTVESLAVNTTSNANCSLSVGGDTCLQDVLADTIGLGKVPEGNCTVDTDGAGCFGSVTIGTPLDAGLGADPFLLTVYGDATMQTALMDTANVTMNANIGIDAVVGNDLVVGNNANVSNTLDVSIDVVVGNDLTVGNNASIASNLVVSGNARLENDLLVISDATVGGDILMGGTLIAGAGSFIGNVAILGSINDFSGIKRNAILSGYSITPQNLLTATETVVTWSGAVETISEGAFIRTGSLFTCNATGNYLVNFEIVFNTNANGNRYIYIDVDTGGGFVRYLRRNQNPWSVVETMMEGQIVRPFSVGDVIRFSAYQSSGGSLSINPIATMDVGSTFYIQRLG